MKIEKLSWFRRLLARGRPAVPSWTAGFHSAFSYLNRPLVADSRPTDSIRSSRRPPAFLDDWDVTFYAEDACGHWYRVSKDGQWEEIFYSPRVIGVARGFG